MAGKSSKSEVVTLRVPNALAAEWRTAAEKGGVTVGAMVIDLAMRGRRLSAKVVAPVETSADDTLGVLKLCGEIDGLTKAVAVKDAKIAELERLIAARAKPVVAALRSDPAMKAVVADGGELKPVALVLPVTGTEFPARPVYLRGQTLDKGKGKRS